MKLEMAELTNRKRALIIALALIAAAILSVPAIPQQVSIGCCCNLNSGQALKPSTQSQAECSSGYTYTQITKFPFDATTVCTETCGTAVPPPTFPEGLLQCGDPLFKPKVKNLAIFNQKGTNNLRLVFDTECPSQTNYFDISKCKGSYESCTAASFKPVAFAAKDKRVYIDTDPTMLYHQDYTYKVVVNYQFTNGNSEPAYITGNPGDLECEGALNSENFCIGDSTFYANKFKDYLQRNGYIEAQADQFKTNFDYTVSQMFGAKLNSAFYCNSQNQLQNTLRCSQAQNADNRCVVRNNVPQCLGKEDCKQPQPGTALGLGFTVDNCEKKSVADQYGQIGSLRYCFFDRSGSVANDCFDCRQDMSCYDYRSKASCERNNCGAGSCAWADIYPTIGIGACRDLRTSNCFLCELKGTLGVSEGGYNEIFDVCSPAKNAALSVPGHPCNYQSRTKTSTDCNAITCRDYDTQQTCAAPASGIQLNPDNSLKAVSGDACNLRVCAWIAGVCAKDADGRANLETDRRDCSGKQNVKECELDTTPPTTSVVAYSEAPGRTDKLLITRMDAFNRTMDPIEVQPTDYPTWFCTYPAGGVPCTTFNVNTRSRSIDVQNARILDGTRVLAALSVGNNIMRYYSEDPNHNLEVVKEISFVACDKCQGPPINNSYVSNAIFDSSESRHYTRDASPYVVVQWDVPVTIQRGLFLASGKAAIDSVALDISSTVGQPSSTRWKFTPRSTPQAANIVFSAFATDIGTGIAMEKEYLVNITIDAVPPSLLGVTISDPISQGGFTKQTINGVPVLHVPKPPVQAPFISTNTVNFVLNFSKFVILDNVSVVYKNFTGYSMTENSITITPLFETLSYYQAASANKTFTLMNGQLPDGSNTLIIKAHDRATNTISASVPYVQASGSPQARLFRPTLGGTSAQPFDLEIQTLTPATCRYFIQTVPGLGAPTNPNLWGQFDNTGDLSHVKNSVTLPRQEEEFPLKVYCKDAANREGISTFSLIYDPTAPAFNSSYPRLDPDTIIEQPATTTVTSVTDDYTFCKYDFAKAPGTPATTYDTMPYTFPGFNSTALKIHSVDVTVTDFSVTDTTPYSVIVACKNRAGLGPVTSQTLTFRVVPNIAFQVNSTTLVSYNQSPVFVGAVSNKKSNCYYEESGSRWLMEADGQPSRSHKNQVPEREGNHTGAITCQPTGISSIGQALDMPVTIPVSYIVDLTDPFMEWVNDSSSNINNPRISTLKDSLLLAWEGNDGQGSGINYYNVTIKNLTSPYPYLAVRSLLTKKHFNATHIYFGVANKSRYVTAVQSIDYVNRRSQPMTSGGVETDFAQYPAHCSNNLFDPSTESDRDCGGECVPCIDGNRCNGDADCVSLTCTGTGLSRTCKPNPTCTDTAQNGEETDINCGGSCPSCGQGQNCMLSTDCQNYNNAAPSSPILICTLGKCTVAGTCENGIKDGTQTDIDCGGSCPACSDGLQCKLNTDCRAPDSTCDAKYTIKLNYSTPTNPPSYREIQLLVPGGGAPTDSYLQGLFGTNTSFLKAPQYGVCVNQVIDTDRDGMPDAYEDRHGLDKNNPGDAWQDPDRDGNSSLQEYQYYNTSMQIYGQIREIDPMRSDTDGDGYSDNEEMTWGTNPVDSTSAPPYHDKDGDGMSDTWELRYNLDPASRYDKDLDPDGDNITNWQEFNYTSFFGTLMENAGTAHPAKELNPKGTILPNGRYTGFDTDADGFSDNQEIINKNLGKPFDPLDPNAPPSNIDSDGDGMPDGYELRHNLNPFNASDRDIDYDHDTLTNFQEFYYYNTSNATFGQVREIDPRVADTDMDGFNDGAELRAGSNPVDPTDPGTGGVVIKLMLPKFGVTGSQPFIMQINTSINSTCRYWFSPDTPPVPKPGVFASMDQFDTTATERIHTKNQLGGIKPGDAYKQFTMYVTCIDAFSRQKETAFNLSLDNSPPTIIQAYADPEPVAQSPLNTTLVVVTDHPSLCKYSKTTTDFNQMEGLFPGFTSEAITIHSDMVALPSAASFTYNVACINPVGLGPTSRQILVRVDPAAPLQITRMTPSLMDTLSPLIAARTNKDAVCDYLEGLSMTRIGDGSLRRAHELQIPFTQEGKHTAKLRCTTPSSVSLLGLSETVSIDFNFTIDLYPPNMDYVNDDGPLQSNPEVSYFRNRLRVKWKATDNGGGVSMYYYKLQNQSQGVVINDTPSAEEDNYIWAVTPLVDKQRYVFSVFARDFLNHSSYPIISNGVTVDFSALPAHCTNGIKDTGSETDIDCGLECPPCNIGLTCSKDIECTSMFCNIFITPAKCQVATCTDRYLNQNETDVDCGGAGVCGRCNETKTCNVKSDCMGNLTCKTGVCTKPTACENGQLDPGETDIDCGGTCGKCSISKLCRINEDCASPLQCMADDSGQVKRCLDLGLDSDHDGMPDWYEITFGLNPNDPSDAWLDPDLDLLANLQEFTYYNNSPRTFNQTRLISPKKADTDSDGFTDKEEIDIGTNPIDPASKPPPRDTDRDGMPDEWEDAKGLNKLDSSDAARDFDGDLLTNLQEYNYYLATGRNIDPKKYDTDRDGFNDKVEIDSGTDPADPASHPPLVDSDGDGMPDTYELKHYLNPIDPSDAILDPDTDNLTNYNEYLYYSVTGREINPRLKDTDSDSFLDYQEIILGSNPVDPTSRPANLTAPADADRDGMPDWWESAHGLNPNDATDANLDPDRDGLTNFQEFQYYQFTGREIDPQARDSDGDGYTDGQEIAAGTNPMDARSKPSYPPDTDGDGMPNDYETRHGLNPVDPSDAALDPDSDGLTNLEEYNYYRFTGREIDPKKADSDVDGASDKVEILAGTNPIDPTSKPMADSDSDGMSDAWEVKHGLNPNDPADAALDPDGDGLTNLQEYIYYTTTGREIDPKKVDTDSDGFNDLTEILLGFNPVDATSKPPAPTPLPGNDKDGDGMADDWEARHNLDPNNASDAGTDPDRDGLTNLQEYQHYAVTGKEIDPYKWDTDSDGFSDKTEIIAGTNPVDPNSRPPTLPFKDSDGDGMPDDYEIRHGLNPNDPNDALRDPDKDGLSNLREYEYYRDTGREIDPLKADTDGDGFTDSQEILFGSNPVDYKSKPPLQDTDGDGMDDLWELQHGLNPNDATDAAKDADRDGMSNLEEYQYYRDTKRNIDPQKADTDSDGYTDKEEVDSGSDPTDPRSVPPDKPNADCNNDGIPDNYAKRHNMTTCGASDAMADYDNDTMNNLAEYYYFRDTGREIDPRRSDTDSDTQKDNAERDCGSNPVDASSKCSGPVVVSTDTDNDGMPDTWELRHGLNPNNASDASIDSDTDGLTNLQEYQYYLNTQREIDPKNGDTDADGYNDYSEINANPPTNPVDPNSKPIPGGGTGGGGSTSKTDTDKDGMPDTWEEAHGLDPNDAFDAKQDPDGDGLTNLEEYRYYRNTGREIDPQSKDTDSDGFNDKEEIAAGTNPVDPADHPLKAGGDSDSDGMPDDWETRHGLNPNNAADASQDPDRDGITNLEEYNYYKTTGREIDPQKADTDSDGYTDKEEIAASTDPTDAFSKPQTAAEGIDTDKDGMPDSWETKHGLNPNDPYDADLDPDKDGMTNKAEYDYFKQTGQEIDPQKSDTDSDGFSDKAEIEAGTNPIDPNSTPAAVAPPDGALDSDNDGMPDSYEEAHGLDKNDPTDALQDPAGSGMTNLEKYEYFKKTGKFIDPFKADTDSDGFKDKEEIDAGTDPTDPESHPSGLDSDADEMPDDWEIRHGLNPNDPSDAPLDPAQSGMTNLQKYQYYKLTGRDIDPFKADNDEDGWNDNVEIAADTNPVDPANHPTSKWWIILYSIVVLSLLGAGGYAIYKLMQQPPKSAPKPIEKAPLKAEPKPYTMPPKPAMPQPAAPPKEDVFKRLQQVSGRTPQAAGQPQLTPLERLAIESLPEFEKEKMAVQLEKLRKGLLSKQEREELFRKLRDIASYWSTHKEELAKQKAAWLGAKGTTVTKIGKPAPSIVPEKAPLAITPSKPAPKKAAKKMPETKTKPNSSSKRSTGKKSKK